MTHRRSLPAYLLAALLTLGVCLGTSPLTAEAKSTTYTYLLTTHSSTKVYSSPGGKVVNKVGRDLKVKATSTVSHGYRKLANGHYIKTSDLANTPNLTMSTTVEGVHAYNSIGGSVAAKLKKGTKVKMTRTISGPYRKTAAGNWILNHHLKVVDDPMVWAKCGKLSLGGATFASGKVTAKMSHLVTVNGSGGSKATVTLWQRRDNHRCSFEKVRSESGRVGAKGIVTDSKRKQNTYTTPAGVYSMTQGFSVGSTPKTKHLKWHKVDGNDYWDEDPKSDTYNTYRTSLKGFRASESERLADYPTQYRYAIVINFNAAQVPGKGAGIFLHVNGSGATAGCVSVSKDFMVDFVHAIHSGDLIGIVK